MHSIYKRVASSLSVLFIVELRSSPLASKIQLVASFMSVASCVWLAYILFFVLNDICVVCCTMYAINTGIFINSIFRYQSMSYKKNKKRQ